MKTGFDNKKYVKLQSKRIKDRIKMFDKLYLEVGGKLFDDNHATRVLPGFELDSKIRMFQELKDDLEIILCINADAIIQNKIREDYGITYDVDCLRLIDNLEKMGFSINSVVITLFKNQDINQFIKKLEINNIKYYTSKKNVELFERNNIFTKTEVIARQEILLENYCKIMLYSLGNRGLKDFSYTVFQNELGGE